MSKFLEAINDVKAKSEMLVEMPHSVKPVSFDLQETYNKYKSKLVKIDNFMKMEIWTVKGDNPNKEIFVVQDDEPMLYVAYKELGDNQGVVGKNVFQKREVTGLARDFYKKYLLPTYKIIFSDEEMTIDGVEFYEKLARDGVNISAVNTETNKFSLIENPSEIWDFWGVDRDDDITSYTKYRFMLRHI